MIEALKMITYFKVSFSTHYWVRANKKGIHARYCIFLVTAPSLI